MIDYRSGFPNNKRKALIMSFDDGRSQDRRLIEMFNRYGIRGTFHLNSATLGQEGYVSPAEVHDLYRGHEVSSHTVNHHNLTELSPNEIRREIAEDIDNLGKLTGYLIRGLAYPYGAYNQIILNELRILNIDYARTTIITENFTIQKDFLTFETTCHHSRALEIGTHFLKGRNNQLELMLVWGHSHEFDGILARDKTKEWQYIERFCQMIYESDSVWSTTAIEFVDYVKKIEHRPY